MKLTFSSGIRIVFGNGSAIKYQDIILWNGVFQAEHNTLIQSISTVGLMGTVSLFMLYISMYKTIVSKNKKSSLVVWMPFGAGLLNYMSISALYSDQFNIFILISFIAINVFSKEKNGLLLDKKRLIL